MACLFKRLFSDRTASVAIIVAIGNLAVVLVAGLTVDVARGQYIRERLVSAVDSAALAGGKVINSANGNQWYTDAQEYFQANFPVGGYTSGAGYMGTTVTQFSILASSAASITLSSDQTQLTVQAHVSLPTTILSAFGYSTIPVTTSATAFAGKVEVALVLDNSGSMNDTVSGDSKNKISLLQTAADNFISQLTSLGNGNVKIGVVPFTAVVNTGYNLANYPNWMDGTASYIYQSSPKNINSNTYPSSTIFKDIFTDSSGNKIVPSASVKLPNRFSIFGYMNTANSRVTWAGCVEMRPPPYDMTDTAPTTSDLRSYFVPYFAPSEPSYGGSNAYYFANSYMNDYNSGLINDDSSYSNWLAQQGDYLKYTQSWIQKSGTLASNIEASTGSPRNYTTGPNSGCTGYDINGNHISVEPIQRLTTTTSTLTTEINAMTPMGDTYIPGGLTWAWQILSPNGVFSSDGQAAYTNGDTTKVVIVVTDGCNHILNPNATGSQDTYGCANYTQVNPAPSNPSNNKNYDPNSSLYMDAGYNWQSRIGPLSANTNTSDPTDDIMLDRMYVADQEMKNICAAMKADNIAVYTIGIDAAGSNNPALPSCASKPAFAYVAPDPANLGPIFQTLASQLTTVRIIIPPSTT